MYIYLICVHNSPKRAMLSYLKGEINMSEQKKQNEQNQKQQNQNQNKDQNQNEKKNSENNNVRFN